MYTYTYNHLGYTVYKNNIPVHKAAALAKSKRYNKADAENNKRAAIVHINLLKAIGGENDVDCIY